MRVEGSEGYDNAAVEEARWGLTLSDADPYRLSATGSMTVEGDHGTLVVRARYRKDVERLPEGVVREELGFWTGDDDPDAGDVPFDTDVSSWETDADSPSRFLSVCEAALTVGAEETYASRSEALVD